MERMLLDFQGSLGNISDEIKHLQESSYNMHIELANTVGAEKIMCEYVEKAVIPPPLIIQICDAPIDERYVIAINKLQQQLKHLETIPKHYPSYIELDPILRTLTSTAVFRVKTFLEEKIRSISANKKKNVNTQIYIQQKVLLKYKSFYTFLDATAPSTALEIRKQYMAIMGGHYLSCFQHYTRSLMKKYPNSFARSNFNISTIVENNVLDVGTIFGSGTAKTPGQLFCLKDRYKRCKDNALIPLGSHIIPREFEELWTSIGALLTDVASAEYAFCLEFFYSLEVCNQLFASIFASTLKHLYSFLDSWLPTTMDTVTVLIIIRKSVDFQQTMIRREIREQSLSVFWGRIKNLCLKRFQAIFESNLDSINSLLKPNAMTADIINREQKLHTISKKYAHFTCSIYRLGFANKQSENLKKLQRAQEKVLTQMHQSTGKKDYLLVISCVDHILKIFSKFDVKSSLVTDWGKLLEQNTGSYIEQLLTVPSLQISRIVRFLENCESLVLKTRNLEDNQKALSINIMISGETQSALKFMDILIDEFQSSWAKQLHQLHSQILAQFTNKKTGREILQRCITQFLLYYIRFSKVVEQCYPDANNRLVPQTKIYFEVSKLNEEFNNKTKQVSSSSSNSGNNAQKN